MDMVDKVMIHIPGGLEQNGGRFHDATRNSIQLKTYEWFICGIFHLIFLDSG